MALYVFFVPGTKVTGHPSRSTVRSIGTRLASSFGPAVVFGFAFATVAVDTARLTRTPPALASPRFQRDRFPVPVLLGSRPGIAAERRGMIEP